jgi:membrane associated rhomboid family serine protease
MISDLLYRKKIGIPYISIILIISCLLVSIPTYISPRLYFIFGSSFQGYTATYPWQNTVTSQFEHGTFYVESNIAQGLPLLVHLFGNIIIIGVFGSIVERVVGKRRFLILSIAAASVNYLVRAMIGSWGNGASGIAFVYGPIVFFIIYRLYRIYGKNIFKDFFFYIYFILFLMMWIVIPIGSEWTTNLIHLTATVTGMIFLIFFKTLIDKKAEDILIKGEVASFNTNRWLMISVLALPLFLAIILVLAESGTLL